MNQNRLILIQCVSLVFFLILSPLCPAAAGEKTDVITLNNGDYLTGEIKNMDFGRLRLSTDSMDTVYIEWNDIVQVISKRSFEVELETGFRLFGSLAAAPEPGKLIVVGEGWTEAFEMAKVVRITPIEDTFWDRIDGSVSLGLSYTKSSAVGQYNFDGRAYYRTRERQIDLSLSTINTRTKDQTGAHETTKRADLTSNYWHFWGNRWFTRGGISLQRNDELGIDLRVLAGGAGGRHLIQTNRTRFSALAGLVVNREWVAGSEPDGTSVEGVIGAQFSAFTYSTPKTDISTTLSAFPSITESGRYRIEFDCRLNREIVADFFVNLTGYVSYDSEPPSAEASKSDYGTVFGIGYSF